MRDFLGEIINVGDKVINMSTRRIGTVTDIISKELFGRDGLECVYKNGEKTVNFADYIKVTDKQIAVRTLVHGSEKTVDTNAYTGVQIAQADIEDTYKHVSKSSYSQKSISDYGEEW